MNLFSRSTTSIGGPTLAVAVAVAVVSAAALSCQTSPEPADEAVVMQEGGEQAQPLTTGDDPAATEGETDPDYAEPHMQVEQESMTTTEEVPQAGDEPGPPADGGQPAPSTTDEPGQPLPTAEQPQPEDPSSTAGAPPAGADAEGAPASVDGGPAGSPDELSDDQIAEFAAAFVALKELEIAYEPRFEAASGPEEVADLQHQMEREAMEALQNHEMTFEKFNAIADLLEDDESLRDRIQAEVDALARSDE